MRGRYDEIRGEGSDVVAIGTGDARYAEAFVRDEDVPFTVLVDDDGDAARAASVRSAGVLGVMGPGALAGGLRAFRAGKRQRRSGPRPLQLGATFVVGPGDDVRYRHLDADVGDHAPIDDVLAVLRAAA